jgi:hypothetical protein
VKRRTLRGQLVEGQNKRLIVDDGRLNHGYKVVRFVAVGDPGSSGNDAYAVLSLDYDSPATWDWGDNRQIAWSGTPIDGTGGVSKFFELVDPDHVVIMDLYIQGVVGGAGGSSVINYFIELEPVELSNDQAILTLIKERSQDDLR